MRNSGFDQRDMRDQRDLRIGGRSEQKVAAGIDLARDLTLHILRNGQLDERGARGLKSAWGKRQGIGAVAIGIAAGLSSPVLLPRLASAIGTSQVSLCIGLVGAGIALMCFGQGMQQGKSGLRANDAATRLARIEGLVERTMAILTDSSADNALARKLVKVMLRESGMSPQAMRMLRYCGEMTDAQYRLLTLCGIDSRTMRQQAMDALAMQIRMLIGGEWRAGCVSVANEPGNGADAGLNAIRGL